MLNGSVMALCALYAAFNNFDTSFSPLLLGAIISALVGCFPLIFVKETSPIKLDEGFLIIVLSWFLCCIFGMIPYVLWGGEFNLVNAWFESTSGYTTTGASILTDVESLPRGLLLWRSSTQFLGGIGIVVFMLLILPSIEQHRSRISGMEISDLTRGDYRKRTFSIIKIRVSVYIGLIILEWIALMIAGMPAFDAINISFTTIATGGFTIKNSSIASYNSFPIECIVAIFMVLSALHFGLIYYSVVNRSTKLFKSAPTKLFFKGFTTVGLLITLNLLFTGQETNVWHALRVSFFQTISAASCTGFGVADASKWPMFSIILLMLMGIQGGCTGSTTGGIKTDRVAIFFSSLRAQMVRYMHPDAVVPVKVGKSAIKEDVVSMVNTFIIFYLLILVVCALIYCATGMPAIDAFSTSVSCIGGVGSAFGAEGPMGNNSQVPLLSKFIMPFEMLIGRLELFPFFAIFYIRNKR
ncbi:MAG: TrkH family potassium uptake protein [Bacteroidales bacterium]|nr:TrkH family potassium uptake protein [Bacteroidales bacterium]MCI2144728.1 TrkH family potassium uptake protein [Bacteroidales bacterium]